MSSATATMADQLPMEAGFDNAVFNEFVQDLMGGDPVVRFIKVGWYYQTSDDKQRLDDGVEIVVNPMKARRGWLRFDNKNVLAERRLGLVADAYRPEPREALGFADESEWKTNEQGQPQDPWSETLDFPGVLVGEKGNYKVNVGGTSWAWRSCAGRFFQQWMSQRTTNTGKVPVIKLLSAEKETKRGPAMVPVIEIDRWVDPTKVEVNELPESANGQDKEEKKAKPKF